MKKYFFTVLFCAHVYCAELSLVKITILHDALEKFATNLTRKILENEISKYEEIQKLKTEISKQEQKQQESAQLQQKIAQAEQEQAAEAARLAEAAKELEALKQQRAAKEKEQEQPAPALKQETAHATPLEMQLQELQKQRQQAQIDKLPKNSPLRILYDGTRNIQLKNVTEKKKPRKKQFLTHS